MEYLRNLKINNEKVATMKLRVEKYWKFIQWKNNATCQDLQEATRAAKLQLDCGAERMMELMPKNNCFHSWVAFSFVMTRLYNRDKPSNAPEMLCIIRMVLNCTQLHG